jgi:hypothetical protein
VAPRWRPAPPPPLEQVLANVVLGRGQRLRLSEKQRRELGDRDGRIALQVLRALVRARQFNDRSPKPFPLTEDAFQAIARRLGHQVGDKRARAIIKRCVALGVLENAGSYRQSYKRSGARSGFRVPSSGSGRPPPLYAKRLSAKEGLSSALGRSAGGLTPSSASQAAARRRT